MNLSEMQAATPPASPERTTDADISAFFGLSEKTAVITLRELDAPRVFQIEADAKMVRKMRPQWPEDLRRACALLGLAHVSPRDEGCTPLEFYVTQAERNKALFQHVVAAYGKAFPGATQDEDEDASKND